MKKTYCFNAFWKNMFVSLFEISPSCCHGQSASTPLLFGSTFALKPKTTGSERLDFQWGKTTGNKTVAKINEQIYDSCRFNRGPVVKSYHDHVFGEPVGNLWHRHITRLLLYLILQVHLLPTNYRTFNKKTCDEY